MCGIFGMVSTRCKPLEAGIVFHYKLLIRNLMKNSVHRGEAASGLAITKSCKSCRKGTLETPSVGVFKSNVSGTDIIITEGFNSVIEGMEAPNVFLSCIGHVRHPTKGTPENNRNNHPIISNNVIGVHNGVILNDDYVMDSFGLERGAEVDSEAIFSLLDSYINSNWSTVAALRKMSGVLRGTYTCGLMNINSPEKVYLCRGPGSDSVYIRIYKHAGLIVFASERGIIESSINKHSFLSHQECTDYVLEQGSGAVCDAIRGTVSFFGLEERTN